MKSKVIAATAAGALAASLLAQSAQAHIATISGAYDDPVYDTPSLVFHNTSAFSFTNVVLTLHGYQAGSLTFGLTQSRNLADIAPGDTIFSWLESGPSGNLFHYDYDDQFGGGGPCPPNPVNSGLCNDVGNFDVTFTAMWNGQPIFSVFSPHVNATGGFVGWEGIAPDGLSENPLYDVHNGSLTGVLAFIDIGVPPSLPEPGTLALLTASLAGLGFGLRRKPKA
jgi:hypothetical protein